MRATPKEVLPMPCGHGAQRGQANEVLIFQVKVVRENSSKSPVGDISVATLIRTDTTLDHSQKAEKV